MKHLLSIIIILALAAGSTLQAKPLADQLGDKLVVHNGKKLEKADSSVIKDKDIIAVYYSAHWCPPCRAFTPKLADFYEDMADKYENFQLVFVSSDKNEKAMAEYMEWGDMEFPAVAFDEKKASGLTKHSARGIPYLVVLDQDGKKILGAPNGKDWVHPSVVLEQLEDLLKKKGKKA